MGGRAERGWIIKTCSTTVHKDRQGAPDNPTTDKVSDPPAQSRDDVVSKRLGSDKDRKVKCHFKRFAGPKQNRLREQRCQ